jgi:hypothetical protein
VFTTRLATRLKRTSELTCSASGKVHGGGYNTAKIASVLELIRKHNEKEINATLSPLRFD